MTAPTGRRNLLNMIRTTSDVVSVAAMCKQYNDDEETITHCDEMSRVREGREGRSKDYGRWEEEGCGQIRRDGMRKGDGTVMDSVKRKLFTKRKEGGQRMELNREKEMDKREGNWK